MALTIIGIIVSLAIMVFAYICTEDRVIVSVAIFGALTFSLFSTALTIQDEPTAIEVYRGKTTLKITYVDSVATDSIVVFKEQ